MTTTDDGRGEIAEGERKRTVTQAVREADQLFVTCGGSTRHYVRDCFLPGLEKLGYTIMKKDIIVRGAGI